jgi:hypothetical protein
MPSTRQRKDFFDRINRIKRWIKREAVLSRPEGGLKVHQSPLAMVHAISGFRPLIGYPANPVNPV